MPARVALGVPGSGERLPLVLPDDRDVHTTSVKVRFYELDPYDHVNHTNYFGYFETARVEFLTEMGWGLDVLKKQGLQFVVVEAVARFLSAATYGQELTIHTWVEDVGRVKSTWQQRMVTGDTEVARLGVTFAATDLEGKPRRMPEDFVELF
jgi:acyl-CoA thioester hydrolase